MFKLNMLFLIGLIACLASVIGEDALELTDVQKKVEDTNPAAVATLSQLRVKESNNPDAFNSYKCTVGYYPVGNLACTAFDSTSWPSPHDVELKLRCPRGGIGLTLSYVEIIYSVTSASVNCYVHEGGVGLGYIGVTVNAWNTLILNYSAKFYTY